MKRVLMIAYHFPPLAGSSGIQRTLRFVQQLPGFGWQPLVLTAHPRAYERTATDLDAQVPRETVVRRAQAFDTARHLSVGGRYLGWMARPDRWASWKFDAVRQGMRLIREFRPDAIWSTYPIATAHIVADALHRRSGIPWIADFRDPMAQPGYPADPATWRSFDQIERRSLQHAVKGVFTTPGAAKLYRDRYPSVAQRITVVENGYDEDSFQAAERALEHRAALNPGAVTLLHSGIVYPDERDPTQLFLALSVLAKSGRIRPGAFKLRFRAAVHDNLLRGLSQQHGLSEFIEICPAIPYAEALQEMLRADALLVMQSSGCNDQIPAKIYEYLRAGRPIIGLSDPSGDTIGVLRAASLGWDARLDDSAEIATRLGDFIEAVRAGTAELPAADFVRNASRRGRTQELAQLLNSVAR